MTTPRAEFRPRFSLLTLWVMTMTAGGLLGMNMPVDEKPSRYKHVDRKTLVASTMVCEKRCFGWPIRLCDYTHVSFDPAEPVGLDRSCGSCIPDEDEKFVWSWTRFFVDLNIWCAILGAAGAFAEGTIRQVERHRQREHERRARRRELLLRGRSFFKR